MHRTAARILLSLFLGALTNIAIAWASCLWLPTAPSEVTYFEDWQTRFPDVHPVPGRGDSITAAHLYERSRVTEYSMDCVTQGSESPLSQVKTLTHRNVTCRAGFPLPSFVGTVPGTPDAIFWPRTTFDWCKKHAGAVRVQWPGTEPRALPYGPLWPGLLLNTASYAAGAWLLIALPGTIRHRRRVRHNLCPHCAYPIGTSPVCTECGRPLEPRSGAFQ
jgi:hypothetical protein